MSWPYPAAQACQGFFQALSLCLYQGKGARLKIGFCEGGYSGLLSRLKSPPITAQDYNDYALAQVM